MTEKKNLALKIMDEVAREEKGPEGRNKYQETDFDNPFNTAPPAYNSKVLRSKDGKEHQPCLNPKKWVTLPLESRKDV